MPSSHRAAQGGRRLPDALDICSSLLTHAVPAVPAVQLAVAYALVMVLLVVSAPYHAVNERSTWTVFIVVAIHEPLAGG